LALGAGLSRAAPRSARRWNAIDVAAKEIDAVRDDREVRRASVAAARGRAPTLLAETIDRENDMFLWECRRHSRQVLGQQGRPLPARLHRIEGPEPDLQRRRSRLQLEVAVLGIRKERIDDK
jgi:hypothetical protein